jgi:hypothetical protein
MIQVKGKYLSMQIKGIEEYANKLASMVQKMPRSDFDSVVKTEAELLQSRLKNAYQPYTNTGELQRSISIYQRKKKDKYFTYYIGPQYSGNKKQVDSGGKSAAGNAAHFLEYGTVDRYVANVNRGGVSMGKGRQYGAKIFRGRVAPIGLIRRTVTENYNTIATHLVDNISKALLKWYQNNGLNTKK